MAYRRGGSPLVTGILVGVGVWLLGYLGALAIVGIAPPRMEVWGYSIPEFAATILVSGSTVMLLMVVDGGPSQVLYLLYLVPSVGFLLVTVAGGAVVTNRTEHLDSGWAAAKAGGTVGIGVCLMTLTVLGVYLVPSTPFESVPLSLRYFVLFFGNLLVPALLGALGGTIQHTTGKRQ